MKIVTFKDFLKYPSGTIFSYYEPCVFRGLNIKYDSMDYGDFVMQDLIGAVKCDNSDEFVTQCEKAENGEEIEMDYDCAGREGMFDDKQLYAVYSKEDLEGLKKLL